LAYAIDFKPAALRDLKKLPKDIQQRISNAVSTLADDPRPHGVKVLQGGDGLLRLRVGDYRVVYRVEDRALLVLVIRVGHRREVYR
jgi:mRNA interferase RelE/StbE